MAMPENGIEVTSHESRVTSHQSLVTRGFAFLISHSSEAFKRNQRAARLPGLTPNLEPRTPNYAIIEARIPTYFLKER